MVMAGIGAFKRSAPADIGGMYYALKGTEANYGGVAASSLNLVPDVTAIKKTNTAETAVDSGVRAATGVVAASTRKYRIVVPCDMTITGFVILKGKTGVWNPGGASATNAMRINLDLQKNAVAITGVTKVSGVAHIPNNAAEQNYNEYLKIALPETFFAMGSALDIVTEQEVTAYAASDIRMYTYADPATPGNELVIYLQLT